MRLPLAHPDDPVVEIDESIELTVSDLLDIDGSDDQTVAVQRGLASKLMAARRERAARYVAPAPASAPEDDNRPTTHFGAPERHVERYAPPRTSRLAGRSNAPAHFSYASPPRNPPSVRDAGSTFEPVTASFRGPAHFAPPRERKVSASYPPIAVAVVDRGGPALAFQERPSRAGWFAAAAIAVVLLIGGSMRVQSIGAAAAPAEPAPAPPAAAAALPEAKPAEPAAEAPKVVHFGEDQGVAIKPSAKPAPAPLKHAAAPVKAKPASTLTLSESKPTEKPVEKKVEKKKTSISDELAEAQLRAAAR